MLLLLTAVKVANGAGSVPGWRSRGRGGSEEGLAGVLKPGEHTTSYVKFKFG